jgi:type IV pilus assembly protein PilO
MSKMKLNNIYDWPLMTKVLLLGLIFFAAFYMGYRFSLANQFTKLTAADQREKDLKQEVEYVVRKNKTTEIEISHLPALRSDLAKWDKQLVKYQDFPELLNQILKIGADNHLFFSLFTPGQSVPVQVPKVSTMMADDGMPPPSADPAAAAPPPPPTDPAAAGAAPATEEKGIFYNKVPIRVVVVGSFNDISAFLSEVANLPMIVVIGNFTMTSEDQSSLIGEKLAKQAAAQHLLTAEFVFDIYNLPESNP